MHDAEVVSPGHALDVAGKSKKPTTTFGLHLEKLLKARGTNKNALAEAWNRLHPDDPIKVYNLTKWSQSVSPSLYQAEKVAAALNVPIDALLGGATAKTLNPFQVRVVRALHDERFLKLVQENLPEDE